MATTRSIILSAAIAGAQAAASSPSVAMEQSATMAVAQSVTKEMAPVVAHLSNTEPWYRSRVTLGALLAALAGILGLFGIAFPQEVQGEVIEAIVAAAPLIGGALALYGRWKAKKPIGAS